VERAEGVKSLCELSWGDGRICRADSEGLKVSISKEVLCCAIQEAL
jgi:hypothetical protein